MASGTVIFKMVRSELYCIEELKEGLKNNRFTELDFAGFGEF